MLEGVLTTAHLDGLTGCLNYTAIRHELEREVRRSERHNLSLSCCFLDLDDFKLVNDRHGHLYGSATLVEVATILAGIRFNRAAVPVLVGLYITAAYWFTASTSFANPAVAIARSLTNTFAGIRPVDLPGFIAAELCGAVIGMLVMTWMLRPEKDTQPLNPEAIL